MQFYILMIDYGRKGLEAVVQPELTRRAIVEQVRDVLADANSIAFVKYVDGNFIEDVTGEIVDEASLPDAGQRVSIAVMRSTSLLNFYSAERRAGADPLTANERMHEFAKRLDALPQAAE